MEDKAAEKVPAQVPADGGRGRGDKNDPFVPHGGKKVVEKYELGKGEGHFEEEKGMHKERLCNKAGHYLCHLCPDYDTEYKTEKDYCLDQGKDEGQQELLTFAFDEARGMLPEDYTERRLYDREQPGRKEIKKEDA